MFPGNLWKKSWSKFWQDILGTLGPFTKLTSIWGDHVCSANSSGCVECDDVKWLKWCRVVNPLHNSNSVAGSCGLIPSKKLLYKWGDLHVSLWNFFRYPSNYKVTKMYESNLYSIQSMVFSNCQWVFSPQKKCRVISPYRPPSRALQGPPKSLHPDALPAPATPMTQLSPHPRWAHSKAARITSTLPVP